MRWSVHGSRTLYESPWIDLELVDVEVPGARRYDHHAIRAPDAAGMIVDDPDRGVLVLWRHRFLSDSWAYEVPGGMIEPGEDPQDAAVRECEEETGWIPAAPRLLHRFHPIAGLSRQTFWIYRSDSAEFVSDPASDEAERVEWVDRARLRSIVDENLTLDAMSVIAMSLLLLD